MIAKLRSAPCVKRHAGRSNYRIKFAVNFHLAKIHAASVIFDYAPVPCDNARKTGGARRRAGEIVRKNLFHLHECTAAARSAFIPAIVQGAIIVAL